MGKRILATLGLVAFGLAALADGPEGGPAALPPAQTPDAQPDKTTALAAAPPRWSAPATHPLREGLVALWSGEGDANDSIGASHGEVKPGVTFAAGKFGKAFRLDGENGYVDFGTPKPLQIAGDQTISLWVCPARLDKTRYVMAKHFNELRIVITEQGVLVYTYGTDGTPQWENVNLDTSPDSAQEVMSNPPLRLPTEGRRATVKVGEWAHVVAVRDLKARNLKWYVNGEFVCQGPAPIAAPSISQAPLCLGKTPLGVPGFAGLVDEVAIWNRALSAGEVRALHAGLLAGAHPLANGLAALWAADGDANDCIGANHGRLKGGVTFAAGRSRQAFQLNGAGNYVAVGDVLNWGTGSWSLAAWFRSTGPDRAVMRVVGKGLTGYGVPGNAGYGLRIRQGALEFVVDAAGVEAVASARQPPADQWHHAVGVLDRAAGKLSLYVDGELAETKAFAQLGALHTNMPLAIGALDRAERDSPAEFFAGLVDEVAMWKRALSAEEVQVLARTPRLRDALVLGAAPQVTRVAAGDRIRISDDSVVVGTIENTSYVLTAFFGKLEIPASRVAGLACCGGASGAWVLLTDGQALRGELADPVVRLRLPQGSTLKIPVSDIRECGYRLPDKDPPRPAAAGSTILLRSGERLFWAEMRQPLRVKTPYGALDLPTKSLLSLEPGPSGAQAVRLVNGSVLSGTLEPEALEFRLELGPEITIEGEQIVRVEWPAKATESPSLALLRMRNGDRLLGEVQEANLTIQTKFGLADFASESVQEVVFDPNQPGSVALKAWGGIAVHGTLANAAVDFEVAPRGPRVNAPSAQIVSIACPFALPARVRKEVDRLVSLLGAASFKDREAATGALVKMGKDILPLLEKYLGSDDPEVRSRVRSVIEQLSGGTLSNQPQSP